MFRVRLDVPTPAPERIRVEGAALHHLRVARVVPGEEVEVFDGRGRAWEAWLETVDEGGAMLRLGDPRRGATGRAVVLLQGLPKGDKLELVLQKATELGVSAVWPVVTARSVARPRPEALAARHARWQRIAEEAARQSGRADVPEVAALRPLDEAVRALTADLKLLVLDEEERSERTGPGGRTWPGGARGRSGRRAGPRGGGGAARRRGRAGVARTARAPDGDRRPRGARGAPSP